MQRMKAEGRYMTEKQKEDRRKALELLESTGGGWVVFGGVLGGFWGGFGWFWGGFGWF